MPALNSRVSVSYVAIMSSASLPGAGLAKSNTSVSKASAAVVATSTSTATFGSAELPRRRRTGRPIIGDCTSTLMDV